MTQLAMRASIKKTFMKFWGSAFKFWLHPWFICCKTKSKKILFLKKKTFLFCTKYILFAEKNIFSCKTKISSRGKKNITKFYTENACVTNKNIYLSKLWNHSAKKIFWLQEIYNFLPNSIISYFKYSWKRYVTVC